MRPQNAAHMAANRTSANDPHLSSLIRKIPPRIRRLHSYSQTPASRHTGVILDRAFFASLRPDTRILEIGAGTGRLADYLIAHTKLRPENYEILDKGYWKRSMPWLKKKIFLSAKNGKIKVTKADMWDHRYPENSYDHILVPESFFPDYAKGFPGAEQRARLNKDEQLQLNIKFLKKLVEKLGPSLRHHGSIRISWFGYKAELAELERQNPFLNFKLSTTPAGGVILERLK